MKPRSLSVTLLLAAVTMIGCGSNTPIPDTIQDSQSPLPTLRGRVLGGHAPLIGAHVYLLQTGSGALGASATSLLGSGTTTSPGGYPLQTNVSDPHIPAGWRYVVTDSNGEFNLSNAYKCGVNLPVYIYAYGGAPTTAAAPEPANPAVVNLATLGVCPFSGTFLGAVSYIYLNEVSTVATAYAFQGFTSSANNDAVHIGYSGTVSASEGLQGIQNAAVNTAQLFDIAGSVANQDANFKTYGATGPNTGLGTVPQAVVDTVANILAACVDSGNAASSPQTACTSLFATATSDGTASGTKPTDTATAAINIARHPAGGVGTVGYVSTLVGIPTGVVPFSPSLSSPPSDLSVAINYPSSTAHPQFNGVYGLAVDGYGYFWFTNWTTVPSVTASPVTPGSGYFVEASPVGIIQTTSGLYGNALGDVAIDSNENAWAGTVDVTQGSIYAGNGSTYSTYGAGFTAPAAPVADASTSDGILYFPHGPTCTLTPPNCGATADNNAELSSVSLNYSHSPAALVIGSSPTYTFPAGAFVTHAAIDSGGFDWMTSRTPTYGDVITRVTASTAVVANAYFPIAPGIVATRPPYNICGSGWTGPEQPAIDANGYAWVPIHGTDGNGTGVFKINPLGGTGGCTYYATGTGPYGAAVDGANNVWITNSQDGTGGPGSLSELSSATGASLTAAAYQPVSSSGTNILNHPKGLAIDISGDVFIANYAGNSIVEFIGLATPLYGPLGVAAGANKIGTAP
jgi:hypothetical protein